jgi:hypothetical protein
VEAHGALAEGSRSVRTKPAHVAMSLDEQRSLSASGMQGCRNTGASVCGEMGYPIARVSFPNITTEIGLRQLLLRNHLGL